MNFIPLFARRNEPGEDHPYDAFFDRNSLTDFELGFVGTPSERLVWCFLHFSIVAEAVSCLRGIASKQ
jgi:hypothetical protein